MAVKDEREPPLLLAYTLPSKGLKRKKKAIDDLARVAGVERAGLGDWEEGKKRRGGGGVLWREGERFPSLFPPFGAFRPFPSPFCACHSGSIDDRVSCHPDVS